MARTTRYMGTRHLKRIDGRYVTLDERYVAVPAFRPARRGPNLHLKDGWTLVDTWTGVRRHHATLGDADRFISNVLADQRFIRSQAKRFSSWFTLATGEARYGFTELRLNYKSGANSTMIGLVSTTSPEERAEGIRKLLSVVCLSDLPEEPR